MIQITDTPVCFEDRGSAYWGHLFAGRYKNGCLAIVAGNEGRIGKLSVNLVELEHTLQPDEFFVKLYGEGLFMNGPCMATGLFEEVGEVFTMGPFDSPFQKWRLKKDIFQNDRNC